MFRTTAMAAMILSAMAMATRAADEPVKELPTVFCEKGKLLLSDDLAAGAIAPEWKMLKGVWSISGGALKGVEKAEDQHAAVIRRDLKARDMVVQFSFRFDGGKAAGLSVNDAKGHVCRVRLTPSLIGISKDKANKNSTDKPAVLENQKAQFKPGEWHTVVVEMVGKRMIATLDEKVVLAGEHDGIDVEKTNIGFPVSGDSVSLRGVRVWEALAPKDADAAMKKVQSLKSPAAPAK